MKIAECQSEKEMLGRLNSLRGIMVWQFVLISTVLTGVMVVVMSCVDKKVQRKIQEAGKVR